MKKFILKEIRLISLSERKARSVKFGLQKNVIVGPNSTGKSCLIKSIYRTFGAQPKKLHPNWLSAEVSSLVKFILDDNEFSMLKFGSAYGFFDSNNNLIESFESVTNDLAPFLASKLNFKIRITNRGGEPSILTPAYYFLPFYIDQDSSWESNWSSFNNLSQFSRWRTPIIEFHTGIKGNEYYETKLEIDQIKIEIKEFDEKLRVLKKVVKDLRGKLKQAEFNIDMNSFKSETQKLISECEVINKKQNKFRVKIVELSNNKIVIQNQIDITKKTLNEIQKDYQFATTSLDGEPVECPTCGTIHENSFADRLSIANDEERCFELLQELNNELLEVNSKIESEHKKLSVSREEVDSLKKNLDTKKGKIKLQDVIESRGRSEMKAMFQSEINKLNELKVKGAIKEKDLKKKLIGLSNKEKRDEIIGYYNSLMKKYLIELEVLNLKEKSYNKITTNISESGSALPRALIAYYYAILNTVKKYSSSIFSPIIIDSPNQQGQDPINLPKIIRFIDKNQPKQTQLILGLEDLSGVEIKGKIIKLKEKFSLLNKKSFDKNYELFKPFINQLSNSKGGLF